MAQTGVDDDRVSLPEGPGSLEGVGDNIDIDPNMGSMSHNISFALPQGRNGMSPATSLSYSSSAPAGLLGIGWSMQMPTIERMSSRGIPEYQPDDLFAANGGSELVLVDDSGSDYVYRERFEKSFNRYIWKNVGGGDQGYWIVEEPDGTRGFYGANKDGQLVASARTDSDLGAAKYHLVDRVDVYGNTVRHSYDKMGGTYPLMTSIEYVFDANDEPVYSVELSYEVRPDTIIDCALGFENTLDMRVSGMVFKHESIVVREAALSYEEVMGGSQMSRLSLVEQWGLGGRASGLKDPIVHEFTYQKGLGATCEGDCDKPYVVSMGQIPGSASLGSGQATLVDINGDSLPDILDTSQIGPHQFFLNKMTYSTADGTYSQSFESSIESAIATGGNFALGDKVQTMDVNGDGYSDLINTTTGSYLLKDPNATDWLSGGNPVDVEQLKNIDFQNARFFDYDLDKKIDVLVSTSTNTQLLVNNGTSFDAQSANTIGVGFADANLQLSDMNGDGMSDIVEITGAGSLRYRVNLGRGNWTGWRSMSNIAISLAEQDLAELEDINGDGRDDIVIVTATQVKYALNKGSFFDAFVIIDSGGVNGTLPERSDGVRVLYSDMNANGSEDVVWFNPDGTVEYLELFPQRANLVSTLTNGIGMVQKVTYGTAAQQRARAEAEGHPWSMVLQMPLPVVDQVDRYATLTGSADGSGLHEIMTYTYRDGYYDGENKQLRGFADVEIFTEGSESQQAFTVQNQYDVGKVDPYFYNLLLATETRTDTAVINRETTTYDACDLAEVPSNSALNAAGRMPIKWVCTTQISTETIEGKPEEAKTTRVTMEYDGYGNMTREIHEGILSLDGDEMTTERTYAAPNGDRWLLGLMVTEQMYRDASGDKTLITNYYDGADFTGLAAGEYTHGFLSRQTVKADDSTTLEPIRQKRDDYGNVIETIDANGDLGDDTQHRRRYQYDDLGLFILETEVPNGDYSLVRHSRYDYNYQKVTYLTDWIVEKGGEEMSARLETNVQFDSLGREIKRAEPGDTLDAPTRELTHDWGNPTSRVGVKARSQRGMNTPDEELYLCLDGRGRIFQRRIKLANGNWLITGFTIYNSRGAIVESYQPYTSDSSECETEPPVGVLSTKHKFDALFRPLEISAPDATIYGEASINRMEYAPFIERSFDREDNDASSPHANTPTINETDGLGRVIRITRDGGNGELHEYLLHYDNTGSFEGYTDPAGNRQNIVVDLAGRIREVSNKNFGKVTYTYDAVGQRVRQKDARGVVQRFEYDGLNRRIAHWDEADEANTRITWSYDQAGDCAITDCTNVAGRLARIQYPLLENKVGSTSLGYDSRGREVKVVKRWDELEFVTDTSYNNVSIPTSVVYPDGQKIETTFDNGNRVLSIKGIIDAIEYNERDDAEAIRYNNGAITYQTYDALRRTSEIEHIDGAGNTLFSTIYERDREGHILGIIDALEREDAPSATMNFVYDALYRNTRIEMGTANNETDILTYTFDDLDNILDISSSLGDASPAHIGTFEYGASQPNAVTGAGEVSYTYDEAGQMTTRGAQGIAWSHRNLVEAIDDELYLYGPGEELVGKMSTDSLVLYSNDDFEVRDGVSLTYITLGNRRVALKRSTSLMTTIYPDLVEDGQLTAADAFASALDADAASNAAVFSPASATERMLGAVAARMIADEQEDTSFFQHDHLGSIIIATDNGGLAHGERGFYPTGLVRWETGFVDTYGFTGQEHTSSGMIRFQYRHLDPRTGRWMSFDPAFMAIQAEAMALLGEATTGYAYVAGDFGNSTDPTGLTRTRSSSAGGGGGGGGGRGRSNSAPAKQGQKITGMGQKKFAKTKANVGQKLNKKIKLDTTYNKNHASVKASPAELYNSLKGGAPAPEKLAASSTANAAPADQSRAGNEPGPVGDSGLAGQSRALSAATQQQQSANSKGLVNMKKRQSSKESHMSVKMKGTIAICVLGVLGVATMLNPFDGDADSIDIGEAFK
ncbi:MAG: SpvB/TcaC N-terminal domain-containing protein [Myxococcota bacterium]|nr:SpvB/TcaC N-terminal domain-containing protein [Myxococcota bacterium]